MTTKAAADDACDLATLIEEEVTFPYNLRFVLSDASQAERDALRQLFARAKREREVAKKRIRDKLDKLD